MRTVFIIISIVLLNACAEPFLWLPGGALSGPVVALDLETLPADASMLQLETNPDDPYSVNLGFTRINGKIYIDPAAERAWFQNIQSNPAIRFRVEGYPEVHPATAIVVTDPAITKLFEPDRVVLELRPD